MAKTASNAAAQIKSLMTARSSPYGEYKASGLVQEWQLAAARSSQPVKMNLFRFRKMSIEDSAYRIWKTKQQQPAADASCGLCYTFTSPGRINTHSYVTVWWPMLEDLAITAIGPVQGARNHHALGTRPFHLIYVASMSSGLIQPAVMFAWWISVHGNSPPKAMAKAFYIRGLPSQERLRARYEFSTGNKAVSSSAWNWWMAKERYNPGNK